MLLPESARQELNKLASVAERARAAGAERNHSNTGTVVTAAGMGGALPYAPGTIAGLLVGANVTSRFMTNPVSLRALNSLAKGNDKPLRQLASGDGAFTRDAQTILRLMAAEISSTSQDPRRAVGE